MNIDEIIQEKESLECQIRNAASTMEKSDKLQYLFNKMQINQNKCPHFSSQYNWVQVDDHCPYCGKKLSE